MTIELTIRSTVMLGSTSEASPTAILCEQEGQFYVIDYFNGVSHSIQVPPQNDGQIFSESNRTNTSIDLIGGVHSVRLPDGVDPAIMCVTAELAQDYYVYSNVSTIGLQCITMIAATVGTIDMVIVACPDVAGFSIYLNDSQTYQYSHHVESSNADYDADISCFTLHETNNGTFLFTGSATGHGVDAYLITDQGNITFSQSIGVDQSVPVHTISALRTVSVEGVNYLVAAASGSSSLTMVRISQTGQFSVTDHVVDTLDSRIANISVLETFEYQGQVYILAAGSDDGISLFQALPGGQFLHLDAIADTTDAAMTNITQIEAVVDGDTLNILVTSGQEAGVTVLTAYLGAVGETLTIVQGGGHIQGTQDADVLIDSGVQINQFTGGAGADVFVIGADGQDDTILDFDITQDRLDLSGWTGVYGVGQLDIAINGDTAHLTYNGETLYLVMAEGRIFTEDEIKQVLQPAIHHYAVELTKHGLSLTGTDAGDELHGSHHNDFIDGLGGADRLYGGAGSDTLNGSDGMDHLYGGMNADSLAGGAGADRLYGGNGSDILMGGRGKDKLFGGLKSDTLWGGRGGDSLVGQRGYDSLYGEAGRDNLRGGMGNDLLDGGRGRDKLKGGIGRDTLIGGAGDDILKGDSGADVFVFADNHGDDRIVDFNVGKDGEYIDFSAVSEITNMNDLMNNHITQSGTDTVIDTGSGTIILINVDMNDLDQSNFLF